jgi:glycosyltransferase involved in cell wall biosynthesis
VEKREHNVVGGAAEPAIRVRWEGPQLANHSLALVNREIEMALLRDRRVDLTITPVGADSFAGQLDANFGALVTYYGRSLTAPADVHVRHQWPPNWKPPAEGRWVVIQPWEYGGVPEDWIGHINRSVDEVWVPSQIVRRFYVESGADPGRVHVVPNGVNADVFKPGMPYPLETAKRFRFLFLGGTIRRKGLDVLLRAYHRAFTANDDVSLVIKDMGASDVYRGQGMGQRLREMQQPGDAPHIVYLDRDFSDIEIVQLYNACDCLVHPYRGEGFALTVLEAMACARPVIVTSGGATDDFVDDDTGFRIPSSRVVFGNRSISGRKTASDLWLLEPDQDALRETLIGVFDNREGACEAGRRARQKIEKGWTWGHAAEKAVARMEALKALPVVRHRQQVAAAPLPIRQG